MHKQRRYSLTGYVLNDFEITMAHLLSPYCVLDSTCCVCVIHIVLITTLRDGDSYTQDLGEKAESQRRFVPNPGVRAHE